MAASIAVTSTAAIGLNPLVRLDCEIDILLLIVVDEDRLVTEEGEADLGVDISELEVL